MAKKMKKLYCIIVVSIENLEIQKYQTFSKKHQLLLLFEVSAEMKMEKYLKKKNQL